MEIKHSCKICGKKAIGYNRFDLGEITLNIPVFDCNCKENYIENNKKKTDEQNKSNLLKNCRIDEFFLNANFKVHDEKLISYYNDLNWINQGKQLIIFGEPGNHKTGQATAIMKKALNRNFKCRYYRATEIIYQRDMDIINNLDLLILDNFGRNEFENSRGVIFDLIDYRLHNFKSTIIITNYRKNDIGKIYEQALQDRFSCFISIGLTGQSKRTNLIHRGENRCLN